MHVLILTTVYPPEVRSASQIMFELSETLKNRGHEVTVITAIPEADSGEKSSFLGRFYRKEVQDGVRLIRISTIPIHKTNAPAVLRGIGQLLNAAGYFLAGLFLKKVDVCIAYSPPLTLGLTGYLLKVFRKIPQILNVQDLVPQYAIDLGILKNKSLIRIIKMIERFVYRSVRFISVHSSGNRDYIINEGVSGEKVHVVENWVDTNLVMPSERRNAFSEKNDLNDKFVVLFAGMMGFAQDLDTVIEAGAYLKEHKDILIFLVGEGVEKARLMEKAESMNLKNIRFHPFVSKEKYPEVVAASDACLATLQKDLKCPVIPSKILGYMSAGRPVITSLPLEGDAPHVVRNAESGLCVEPGNPEMLAAAIVEMYENSEKCGAWGNNGRRYIVNYHNRDRCISLYENLFEAV